LLVCSLRRSQSREAASASFWYWSALKGGHDADYHYRQTRGSPCQGPPIETRRAKAAACLREQAGGVRHFRLPHLSHRCFDGESSSNMPQRNRQRTKQLTHWLGLLFFSKLIVQ
jgi:hypothetical protein